MATQLPTAPPAQRPRPATPSRRRHTPGRVSRLRRSRRFRRLLRTVLVLVLVVAIPTGWSLGRALAAPGTDSTAARVAEWARDHGMSPVVTFLEGIQYRLNPPKQGGAPNQAMLAKLKGPQAGAPAAAPSVDPSKLTAAPSPPAPPALQPPVPPVVTPALPGEGLWKPLETVNGFPVVQATYLRPDKVHTSYLAGVVWMDGKRARFQLHPGFLEPGHGPWSVPDNIPPGGRQGLLATFNGAFKISDARGGFYLDGKTVGTLTPGAASEVFYRNGSMTVGAWGRDVQMTPDVVGVRQNLQLLVDQGQVVPGVDSNVEAGWGLTLKGAYYVWRTGVGVTAAGDIVYVGGDALSVRALAELLRRAGAVRAMELDINPAWSSFMSYDASKDPANPTPIKLLPFDRPADRYYQPTSRDFVAVYAR